MADRKITDLTALAAGSQATGDLLTIVDVSEAAAADKNKKITVESLFKGIPSNVGIGTATAGRTLSVDGSIQVSNSTSGFGLGEGFEILHESSGSTYLLNRANAETRFYTNNTERMRIDSSGRLLVGTSAASGSGVGKIVSRNDVDYSSTQFEDNATLCLQNETNSNPAVLLFHSNDSGGSSGRSAIVGGNVEGVNNQLGFYGNASNLTTSTDPDVLIDSSGHLVVGGSASIRSGNIEVIQAGNDTEINVTESSDAGNGPKLRLTRTRGSNVSSPTAISSGNFMGRVEFDSYDSANYRTGARIEAIAAGNWSSNNCPTDLYFSTTASSNNSPTERMRIDSLGNVAIGTSSIDRQFHVQGGGVSGTQVQIEGTTDSAGIKFVPASSADQYEIQATNSSALIFYNRTDGAERMRIAGSGRVGIGTTSPGKQLHVSESTGANLFKLSGLNSYNLDISNTAANGAQFDFDIGSGGGTYTFNNSNGELIRIDSSGRLLAGTTTSKSTAGKLQAYTSSGDLNLHIQSDGLASGNAAYLNVNAKKSGGSTSYNAQLGLYKHSGINDVSAYLNLSNLGNRFMWNDSSGNFRTSTNASHIGTTSGTVVGTQTSDERLKNVGADVAYGLTEVKQLLTKQYALKTDPDTNKLGFIAQQVESIIPEAVFDTNEELDGHEDGDRTKLGMEYVQLIPVLVNAIKELSAEVDTLKTKVAALEAG